MMKAKVYLGTKISSQMKKHIDSIIDSHVKARSNWSRLMAIGDLIGILQTEYDAIERGRD